MADDTAVLESVKELARTFAAGRRERQLRRELDPRDFAALRDAGFLLTGVPADRGGLWVDVLRSTRPIAAILRALARGDPSVALVSSMHPAVLSFWLATPDVPAPFKDAWLTQRQEVTQSAARGAWWGTITSEPGSGGDIANTKAAASSDAGGTWKLTGQKHFGSGSGLTSFVITTAVPQGEQAPDWFYVDMRGRAWDGFDSVPATRVSWPGNWKAIADAAGPFVASVFTAVILGIVDEAIECARRDLAGKKDRLRTYERVEWTRAELEAWLAVQAFEGMLRAVEQTRSPHVFVLRGKTAVAELAESVLQRICRVMGGGTFARQSPYGFWFQDVRALGFLRPPWALALDTLYEAGWPQ
jgi:hypothetical protein